MGWEFVDIDQLISDDHEVRLVAQFVSRLELGPLYDAILARTHGPGRDAIDPALLLALWLYATVEGIGSARELARRCERDLPYRWLCGGVGVNHHALSDFRVENQELLNRLLTDSVTALVADGLVHLGQLAQDGIKVRASAGASSFRRGETLARLRATMAERVAQLAREVKDAPDASVRRKKQAAARAAAERDERLAKAQARLRELEAGQAKRARKDRVDPRTGRDKPVRASTTDPHARVMRMAAGAFRPGYNVQMACDPATLVVVDVGLEDSGTDSGQIGPMLDRIEQRHGMRPALHLADAGFYDLADIEAAHARGTSVLAPSNLKHKDPAELYAPRPKDGPGVAAWRHNMLQPAGTKAYRERSKAECVFAQWRGRGLQQVNVRGRVKVHCVALLHALTHNMVSTFRLRTQTATATA
jgi:transposase